MMEGMMEAIHRSRSQYDWLEKEGRWGGNDQPTFSTVRSVLLSLPVKEVKMRERDTMYIELWRSLTSSEVFTLGRLNPDDPDEISYPDERTVFIFWWD